MRELLASTDILFLSENEYRMLEGVENYVKMSVITKGSEGGMVIRNEERVEVEAFKVEVVDTTGAGDAFAAGFLYAYMKGFSLEVCLLTGNFSASYCIQRIGARNFPEKEKIDRFLEIHSK